MFSYEIFEIFKNTYFEEHLPTTASEYLNSKKILSIKIRIFEFEKKKHLNLNDNLLKIFETIKNFQRV